MRDSLRVSSLAGLDNDTALDRFFATPARGKPVPAQLVSETIRADSSLVAAEFHPPVTTDVPLTPGLTGILLPPRLGEAMSAGATLVGDSDALTRVRRTHSCPDCSGHVTTSPFAALRELLVDQGTDLGVVVERWQGDIDSMLAAGIDPDDIREALALIAVRS